MGLSRLGRYTLLHPLGEGGMALVHVARRDGSPEICALKRLLPAILHHPTAVPRFLREAHLVSYLRHPGIARVQGAGVEADAFCIEMEFIAGATLSELGAQLGHEGATLPADLVATLGVAALDALAHAHTARGPDGAPLGVVHRDLSPRNVMLDAQGQTKIIDFGVARAAVDDYKTAPGVVIGSLRYFSPEQARAEPLDARSDLYSLAVTLYEAITGREVVPARGSPFEVLRSVVEDRVPLASEVAPVPKAVAEVLARGLEKDAAARWPTAAAFRDALRLAVRTPATPRVMAELVRTRFGDRLALIEGWRATARALYAAEGVDSPELAAATKAAKPTDGSPDPSAIRTDPDRVATQLVHEDGLTALTFGGESVPTHLAKRAPPPLARLVAVGGPAASARPGSRLLVTGALLGVVAGALPLLLWGARSTAPAVTLDAAEPPVAEGAPIGPSPELARPVDPLAGPSAPEPAPRLEASRPLPVPPRTAARSERPRPSPTPAAPRPSTAAAPEPPSAARELERRLRALADADLGQLTVELTREARNLPAAEREAVRAAIRRIGPGGRPAADAAIARLVQAKAK